MNKIKKFVGFILLCPGKTSKRFEIPLRSFLPETGQFFLDFPITALKKQSHVFLTLTLVSWKSWLSGYPHLLSISNRAFEGNQELLCVLCVDHTNSTTNSSRYCLANCYFTLTFSSEKIRKATFFSSIKEHLFIRHIFIQLSRTQ